MRLILALLSALMIVISPLQASAATIMYRLSFLTGPDQYKMDFTYPAGTANYNVHYLSNTGTVYDKTWTNPTGILYLTCNGTYSIQFYDGSGAQIGEFFPFQTTQIQYPTCDSYPKQTGANDLDATVSDQGGGNYKIDWTPPPAGGKSVVYKDGQKVQEGSGSSYTGGKGSYTIINYDSSGHEIGRSDKYVPDGYDGSGGTGGSGETGAGGGGSCDGCKLLTDMLDCPGWSQYMGDLTNAIKNALPPPPDWDMISDKIGAATVRHLSNYLGDVPEPPSKEQIGNDTITPLPQVDTSVPDADHLTPTVPSDFNQPIPYNIEDGPQIEIKDESKPFVVTDPLSGMQIDDPGTPVLPGDSRNSSGGIKSPDRVDTGNQMPVPAETGGGIPTPSPQPDDDVPHSDMPIPSGGVSPLPIPSDPGGIIPIPIIH